MKNKCYYKTCQNLAETLEHVPAACFFAKNKRNNLIKVPSCTKHNNGKKLDDEYVRNVFSLYFKNNKFGIELAEKKTFKSFEHRLSLFKMTFRKILKLDNMDSIAFEIDYQRINNWIKLLAYAIYRYEFKKNYENNWYVIDDTSAIFTGNKSELNREAGIRSFVRNLSYREIETSVPEIFRYLIYEQNQKIIYKFIFFDALNYYAYAKE